MFFVRFIADIQSIAPNERMRARPILRPLYLPFQSVDDLLAEDEACWDIPEEYGESSPSIFNSDGTIFRIVRNWPELSRLETDGNTAPTIWLLEAKAAINNQYREYSRTI